MTCIDTGLAIPIRDVRPGFTEQSTLRPARKGPYSAIDLDQLDGAVGTVVAREVAPVTLAWTDVSVATQATSPKRCRWFGQTDESEDGSKVILENVTGFAEPGTITAIMGSSGAGKSTLLEALAERSGNGLVVSGQILANGSAVVSSPAGSTAFVEQDDLFLEWLKVHEHLSFQAAVRMGTSVPTEERRLRVGEAIRSMGLADCSDTVIGSTRRGSSGLSGGERKRLTLASELLSNPSLVFCDEPTTGLDSFLAHCVISSLKSLAVEGRTVLCTIHQPSSSTFALFDKLILVAEGVVAFHGSRTEASTFFESVGLVCPENHNPADYYIRALAIKADDEDECKRRVQRIAKTFSESSYSEAMRARCCLLESEESVSYTAADSLSKKGIDELATLFSHSKTSLCTEARSRACIERPAVCSVLKKKTPAIDVLLHCGLQSAEWGVVPLITQSPNGTEYLPATALYNFKTSWWRQFVACVSRAHLNNKREPLTSKIRLVQTIVLGLVLGLVFLRQPLDQDGVQNINGALFLLVSNSAFANTFTTVQVIPTEMALVKREHRAGLYRLDAWFLAKFITEIPFHMILLPSILVAIPYWMIGLCPAASNFFTACLVVCLTSSTAISFAYFLSSVSRTVSVALAIAPPIVFGLMLLGGLFINVRDIPSGFGPISCLSWFRFGFEALLVNEWATVEVIGCRRNVTATCVESGRAVLGVFSFHEDKFTLCLSAMAALLVGFRVVSLLVLWLRCRPRIRKPSK